jgi:hypothetical protein
MFRLPGQVLASSVSTKAQCYFDACCVDVDYLSCVVCWLSASQTGQRSFLLFSALRICADGIAGSVARIFVLQLLCSRSKRRIRRKQIESRKSVLYVQYIRNLSRQRVVVHFGIFGCSSLLQIKHTFIHFEIICRALSCFAFCC